MKKRAMTYYNDPTRGTSNVDIHESGVKAVEFFKKNAQNFFSTPIIWNKEPKITSNKSAVVRIGMRGYHCRFLSEEENEIYDKHGDNTHIDIHGELCEPPSYEQEESK